MKIRIDNEKCNRCGLCAKVCPSMLIEIGDDPCIKEGDCFSCFQCIAVCPMGAVSHEDCLMEDMQGGGRLLLNMTSEDVLRFLGTRRSIRLYQKRKVEAEKIEDIIEAGRLSPTGCNRQTLKFILLDKNLEEFKLLCMRGMKEYVEKTPDEISVLTQKKKYKFSYLYDVYKEKGEDWLFFNAPQLLIIAADKRPGGNYTLDGGIAAAHMALMAYTYELGLCYVGNLKLAAEICPSIREYLGLKEYEEIVTSMVLGYPGIKYQRTVSRKKADTRYI